MRQLVGSNRGRHACQGCYALIRQGLQCGVPLQVGPPAGLASSRAGAAAGEGEGAGAPVGASSVRGTFASIMVWKMLVRPAVCRQGGVSGGSGSRVHAPRRGWERATPQQQWACTWACQLVPPRRRRRTGICAQPLCPISANVDEAACPIVTHLDEALKHVHVVPPGHNGEHRRRRLLGGGRGAGLGAGRRLLGRSQDLQGVPHPLGTR